MVRDNSGTCHSCGGYGQKKEKNKKLVIQETSFQFPDLCLRELGFWYAGRKHVIQKTENRSLSERKKKRRSQIYKKPVVSDLC